MAFTLNRRLSQLVDSDGKLNTGKVPDNEITSDHLHTSFQLSASHVSSTIEVDHLLGANQHLETTDNVQFNNLTLTGSLRGPATMTIDPAAVGDNTGTLVIAGNLQVDGTTTTINSTTLTVDDLNITLASGAANAAAANGAGITIDGAGTSFVWNNTNSRFDINSNLKIGSSTGGQFLIDKSSTGGQVEIVLAENGTTRSQITSNFGDDKFYIFHYDNALVIDSSANVGIGESSPDARLEVRSSGTGESTGIRLTDTNGTVRGNLYFGGAQNFVIHGASGPIGADAPALQFATGGSTPAVRMTILEEGNVGIGTSSPYKKLEVAGDIQLDATDANIWLKSGAVGTNGFINWTFNTNDSVFNKIGMDYDTRATTGFHIDAGYPITIDASASGGKAINFDIGGSTKAVIDGTGLLGIANDSPSYLVDVGTAASTQSNIFRGTVNGDFIFTLAKNTTNLFSIRNNNTSIVHLNTQNNATLALGVSSTNNTGTTEHQVRIFANGTMAMTATAAGNGSSIFSTGAYGSGQGDNKTHFGYNSSGNYNNYIRGSTTIFSSRVKFDQPLSDSITIDGDNVDPYVYIDGSTNSRDSGVKINAGSGYVNTLRMDAGNNLYIHNNAIHINPTGRVTIANNNNDYSFKAMAGDTDSWFGVYDDANNSANIIVTRSDTAESFKHVGHTGETIINASNTGLQVISTNSSAVKITGNGGGLNFTTGANQRIYFGGARALEGNSGSGTLQLGEGFTSCLYQMASNVFYGNITPSANNTYDLGSSTMVWRDLYIGDLNLNNETRVNDDGTTGNEIDGTTGNWTIQEGSDELYLINNKNGKKYKFVLQEIE